MTEEKVDKLRDKENEDQIPPSHEKIVGAVLLIALGAYIIIKSFLSPLVYLLNEDPFITLFFLDCVMILLLLAIIYQLRNLILLVNQQVSDKKE